MRSWPVKNSYSHDVPAKGSAGSFWEDRGNRFHCGVDIYAAKGSDVVSIEDGMVVGIGIATSPDIIPYWNTTYYIVIKNDSGLFCKYAEIEDVLVKKGETVRSGQLIGHVGQVLNSAKIDETSPLYIQELKDKNQSMLHLELYKEKTLESHGNYLGGNWFKSRKPEALLDPSDYLRAIKS